MSEEPSPRCVECGKDTAQLTPGAVVYPHRPELHGKPRWVCECGAHVGCHAGTHKALGFCGGPRTRAERMAAHRAFDPIWQERLLQRNEAYLQLGRISQMNEKEARRAVAAAHSLYEELSAKRYHATGGNPEPTQRHPGTLTESRP